MMIVKSFHQLPKSVFWLHLFGAVIAYEQQYEIRDALGKESSYLYEGGQIKITCRSDDPKEEVALMEVSTRKSKEIVKGPGNVSHVMHLESSLIGQSFECYHTGSFIVAGGRFTVKQLMCDPFPLIPKAQNCKDSQVCVINKDKTETCNELNDDLCFPAVSFEIMKKSFMSSLPKLRYSCEGTSSTDAHSHGLCHSRVSKLTNITGISYDKNQCNFFEIMLLNGRSVHQDDFVVESNDLPNWKPSFVTTSIYDTIKCKLSSPKHQEVADFTANNTEKTLRLSSMKIKSIPKPEKLHLSCAFNLHNHVMKAISFYVLVIDMKSFVYNTSMTTQVMTPKETISLKCHCSVPPEFVCSLSWNTIKNPPVITKGGMIKQDVFIKDHIQNDVPHNCHIAVFVVGYPTSYKLVELKDARKSLTIVTKKADFDKVPGIVTTKTSSSGTNDTGDPNSIAETSSKPDGKSSSLSPGVIVAIIAVILVMIIGATLAVVFYRRSKIRNTREPVLVTNVPPSNESMPVDDNQIKKQKTSEHSPMANIRPSKDSTKSNMPTDAKPAKQRKSNAMPKSTPTMQNDDFLEKLQSDKDRQITSPQLLTLLSRRDEIVAKSNSKDKKHGYKEYLATCTDQLSKHISKQICDCMLVKPIAMYLLLCRFIEMGLAKRSHVFEGQDLQDGYINRRQTTPRKAMNMSYVSDMNGYTRFILSQAPLKAEMEMFLDTVFQKNVCVIVTLVTPTEQRDTDETPHRVYDYYTKPKKSSVTYGKYILSCIETKSKLPIYETRVFTITDTTTGQGKLVTILSYLQWEDQSNADDVEHLLAIRKSMNMLLAMKAKQARVLIHCSAGVGRSGLLVAVINCIDYMEMKGTNSINVFGIVERLRQERIGSIQTGNQFLLLLWTLGIYIKNKLTGAVPTITKKVPPCSTRTIAKSNVNGKL